MERVIELLKKTNSRISCDNRWLVWLFGEWHVFYRPPYAKKNRVLYTGQDFDRALEAVEGDK